MEAAVCGRPVHTRTLDVEARQRADGAWDVRGEVVDLRKTGFVTIAGDLQMAGLLHQMQLFAVLEPASGALREIRAAQPAVAFEPSALTRGESCRDPAARIEALVGARVDGDWSERLSAAIGGARGCSHVLAVARLLGSTLAWVLRREREGGGSAAPGGARRAGERIVRRTLSFDGLEPRGGRLELALQLTEVRFAPAGELARPLERFAAQHEVRGAARVDLPGFALAGLEVAERRRSRAELASAAWRDVSRDLAGLAGASVGAGASARVLGLLRDRPRGDPLLDSLLQLGPAVLQCFSSLTEHWPGVAAGSASCIVCAGPPDSCYMWRRGGALDRARREEGS